jgi:putative hydrolase of the HAD superfamily
MLARNTIFLDGDDTLWKMQELYEDAKSEFADLLRQSGIAESEDYIVSKLDELDARRVAERGLTIQRFIESMLITYSQLSMEADLEYQISIEKEIVNIADIVKRPPELYEDTLDALERLKKSFRLVLFTAGDDAVQKRKMLSLKKNNSFDVNNYFEVILIVPKKSKESLALELEKMSLPASDVWSVGNSLRSDVFPAISVGVNAVLVARGTWKYDDKDLSECPNHWYKAKSLLDAAEIVLA